MTVTITKPPINIREKLTEANAVVPYEQRQFHFDNLITNGTFDADTDWTKGTGWSISGGVASINNTSGSNSNLSQVLSGVNGKTYAVTVTVSNRSGGATLYVYWGNSALANMGSNGTYTFYVTLALGTNTLYITANNGVVADIDNISVYPSDGTDVAFTMPKGWKPLHVYDDGVLQREGSAEDYEVTFDGFNYYVKPTVANPGARNTVIGVRA